MRYDKITNLIVYLYFVLFLSKKLRHNFFFFSPPASSTIQHYQPVLKRPQLQILQCKPVHVAELCDPQAKGIADRQVIAHGLLHKLNQPCFPK